MSYVVSSFLISRQIQTLHLPSHYTTEREPAYIENDWSISTGNDASRHFENDSHGNSFVERMSIIRNETSPPLTSISSFGTKISVQPEASLQSFNPTSYEEVMNKIRLPPELHNNMIDLFARQQLREICDEKS